VLSTWIYRIASNTTMDHLQRPLANYSLRQWDGAAEEGKSSGLFPFLLYNIKMIIIVHCHLGNVAGLADGFHR
jgi:hypothetical protein